MIRCADPLHVVITHYSEDNVKEVAAWWEKFLAMEKVRKQSSLQDARAGRGVLQLYIHNISADNNISAAEKQQLGTPLPISLKWLECSHKEMWDLK